MRIRGQIWWNLFSKQFKPFQSRPFCGRSKTNKLINADNKNGNNDVSKDMISVTDESSSSSSISRQDAYKELENLNFMTATKILFTTPPKNKKFGLDFHLVQLFFVCLPSLAVYLVAQYARSEMKRMDAELEAKENAEDEAKAKEKAAEKQEIDPQLLVVTERLDKLEETIKEIVVESKKKSADPGDNGKVDGLGRKQPTIAKPNSSATHAGSSVATRGSPNKEAGEDTTPSTVARGCEPSPDVKK